MRAVLDACVLYPTLVRGLLLDAAGAGLITPLWSARILGEWTHAAARQGDGEVIQAEAALVQAQWPGALLPPVPDLEAGLSLPDPDDTHVLAAAISGQARALVTFNLRDFPPRTLARHSLTPWHPDALLLALLQEAPEPLARAIAARTAPLEAAGLTPRAALKRARLPRLGKAYGALTA